MKPSVLLSNQLPWKSQVLDVVQIKMSNPNIENRQETEGLGKGGLFSDGIKSK